MIRFRSILSFAGVAALAVGVLWLHSPAPAVAAPKPTPSPTAAPAPSPTPTPEPLDKQIPRLEDALKANPNDRDSETQLAIDYLQVNRPDLTAQLTQKLLQSGTKTAQVYFLDGTAQGALGKQDAAIASMEQASNLEPTNLMVLQSLTEMYLNANRAADAERVAKRATTFNAQQAEPFETYGLVLAAEKKYDDARAQFEQAQKLAPKDQHPIVLEARVYEEQNAPALAMQLIDRAIALDPTGLEALVAKAQLATQQKDIKTAIATYQTVLGLQTDDQDKAAVIVEEAKAYAFAGQDSQADTTFQQAIQQFPSINETRLVYGDYLMSKNNKPAALTQYTTAAGPNHDQPDALFRLGTYYAQSNDFPKAIDNFKRLTEAVPNDPRGYLALGQAYMANKNFSDAANAFKASYNIAHTPDALVGLAAADQESHNYNEAISIYEALDKNAPDLVKANPGILFNLGKAYQSTNQPQKAKAVYTRFLAFLKPNTQAYTEVRGMIDGIDKGGSSASDKPKPKPSPTPHH